MERHCGHATLRERAVAVLRLESKLASTGSDGAQKSVEVDGIDSTAASRIYAHAQGREQAWEEKNRVRGLEEKRAAAGGVIVGGMAASNNNGALEELERAKKLFDGGGISDAEYHELTAKILSRAG